MAEDFFSIYENEYLHSSEKTELSKEGSIVFAMKFIIFKLFTSKMPLFMKIFLRLKISMLIILFISGCKESPQGSLLMVPAEPSENFNYPYYLFIPDEASKEANLHLIIEPNNSGFASDNFDEHLEKAKRTATIDYYTGNYLATQLKMPLLVPVFPRPKEVWKIYTHALDRDAMLQKGNKLERMDLQLLEMAEDATRRLREMGYRLLDKYIMTGFSASGTFVNRFSVIHPEKIEALAAGGLNGLLILPVDTLGQTALNYPLGTNNIEELTGNSFKKEKFKMLPQFLYMGEMDENDAIPYNDGYDEDERVIIYELLGEKMMPGRWEKCMEIYQNESINAIIKSYGGLGHEHPEEVKEEILEFMKNNI
jgi:hypothetical protein